ncbi:DNA repair protein RadA [Candidatus Dojkabacteria bacterium]|uniref:DNA repair protein RadA n=1 Tax=Candidatus Dojkabacteria bacterium TaxID=2099670 RepID=A0A5C7JB44_9BACT|nr:MAG: DNA repair protein RadA [Candidatus Dojkabacteria bacterium]
MARKTSQFVCQQCGYVSPNFLGKCPECGNWNSMVEQISEKEPTTAKGKLRSISRSEVVNTADIEKKDFARISTTLKEFDRVLGGGIVYGAVVLLAGDPGVGKSTLLSQLAINVNQLTASSFQLSGKNQTETTKSSKLETNSSVLYVAGEESAHQIKLRIERINAQASLAILNETDVDAITEAIQQYKPKLVIIDSIQTLETQDLSSAAGSVSQVRESAHRLQRIAKALHVPMFIVGHVTKEGTVAGPRTLEHLVDVVLNLEGESENQFRLLRAVKNRFGPTDEVGIFEMEETGLKEISNPSELFLGEKVSAPGSAITAIVTGLRPMLVEIQALVTKTNSPISRRVGTGVDNNRLQLLVAVLQKRLRLPLWDQDIFVNVTGGMKITEPAADLAICMAIVSSFKDLTLDPKSVYVGEVGLLGELRTVRQLDKRINEAKKLGYTKVISPQTIRTLSQALK